MIVDFKLDNVIWLKLGDGTTEYFVIKNIDPHHIVAHNVKANLYPEKITLSFTSPFEGENDQKIKV